MKYHAFMSHAQADASGTASTLLFAYTQLGLHNWLDMRQKQLTLEGMRNGVRDSKIFLLILTEHVLTSWFCQQEILTAIEEGKPIQLVVEGEPRFNPFPKTQWLSQIGSSTRSLKNQGGKMSVIPSKIVDMIDKQLCNAIAYRRRDFEQDAMMQELCRRNGVVLPCESDTVVSIRRSMRVFVICADTTEAREILQELRSVAAEIELVQEGELESANRVLLILTTGILNGTSLQQLESTIEQDKRSGEDRITAIFSEEAGWKFGCSEHITATGAVQDCLNEHEAITWRANELNTRHEFFAMVSQLFMKLGAVESQTGVKPPVALVPPIVDVRERLTLAERVISEREAVIAEQAAELTSLRERLLSQNLAEAVPPVRPI